MKRDSFNPHQVCVILRIDMTQLAKLILRYRLEGRAFGRHWRISREELVSVCVFSGVSTRWTEMT